MTNQLALTLDDPMSGRSRATDPQTSQAAARSCAASLQRDILLRELKASLHGLTCAELEARTGILRNTVASRLSVMRGRYGNVEPCGTRLNERGIPMQVWFSVPVSRSVRNINTGNYL